MTEKEVQSSFEYSAKKVLGLLYRAPKKDKTSLQNILSIRTVTKFVKSNNIPFSTSRYC